MPSLSPRPAWRSFFTRVPFSAWFALAALLHALVWSAFRPAERAPGAPPAAEELLELTVLAPADMPDSRSPGPASQSAGPTRDAAPTARTPRSKHAGDIGAIATIEPGERGDSTAANELLQAPSAETGTGPAGDMGPKLDLDQLGIGMTNPFVRGPGEGAAGDERTASEQRLQRSMQESMMSADVARNMARSGPVVVSLREATYGAALLGSAEFIGTVNALGVVVALEPANVSADRARWEELGKRTLAKLAKKKIRVPAGARGLRFRLRVTSQEKLPSGHDPGVAVSALGVPIKKGRGKKSTSIDILKPDVGIDMVEVAVPGSDDPIRLPTLRAGIGVLGLDGDPADIGSTPRQVVHVQVLEEKPM